MSLMLRLKSDIKFRQIHKKLMLNTLKIQEYKKTKLSYSFFTNLSSQSGNLSD